MGAYAPVSFPQWKSSHLPSDIAIVGTTNHPYPDQSFRRGFKHNVIFLTCLLVHQFAGALRLRGAIGGSKCNYLAWGLQPLHMRWISGGRKEGILFSHLEMFAGPFTIRCCFLVTHRVWPRVTRKCMCPSAAADVTLQRFDHSDAMPRVQ